MSNTLDEILERVYLELSPKEAKQQLLAEVLDMIGEDNEIPKRLVEKEHLSRSQRMVKSQNALRSQLRKAAKERFK